MAAQDFFEVESFSIDTDREIYFAGEDIWFHVEAFDSTHQPTHLSKLVYLELVSPADQVVLHQKYPVSKSGLSSRIVLPDSLSSGIYYLRVFSNWKRNDPTHTSQSTFFQLINPLQPPTTPDNQHTSVEVFAEGSRILSGFRNRLVIKTEIGGNLTDPTQLELINEEGEVVSATSRIMKGYYETEFIPKEDETYFFRFDKTRKKPLEVDTTGATMRLLQTDTELSVFYGIVSENDFSLNVTDCNGVNRFQRIISSMDNQISIPLEVLNNGLHKVTIEKSGKVFSERLVYLRKNQTGPKLQLNQRVVTKRDTVKIQVEKQPGSSIKQVTVTKRIYSLDRILPRREADLHLHSRLDDWDHFFQLELAYRDEDPLKVLDAYLITQKKLTHGHSAVTIQYPPELTHQFISGSVVLPLDDNKALSYSKVNIHFAGKQSYFDQFETDSLGRFRWKLPARYYGKRDCIFQAPSIDQPIQVLFDQHIWEDFPSYDRDFFSLDSVKLAGWNEAYILSQLYKAYDRSTETGNYLKTDSLADFYGSPHARVYVEEYIDLKSLKELFKEVGFGVKVREGEIRKTIAILPVTYSTAPRDTPLVLFNGYPVGSIEDILDVPLDQIQYFDVIKENFFIGKENYGGLLNVVAKDRTLNLDPQENTYRIVKELTGYLYQFEGTGTSGDPRIPRLNSTLVWDDDPQLKNDHYSFVVGDNIGEYVIEVSGINAFGSPFESVLYFEILEP